MKADVMPFKLIAGRRPVAPLPPADPLLAKLAFLKAVRPKAVWVVELLVDSYVDDERRKTGGAR